MREASPTCPNCGAASVPEHQPFCSRRCAEVDLGRWLSESYAIPAEPEDDPQPEEKAGNGKPAG